MGTIKRYSLSPQIIDLLKTHLDLLFSILLTPEKWGGEDLFLDTATVLINYSSVEMVEFTGEGEEEVSKLVSGLKLPKR